VALLAACAPLSGPHAAAAAALLAAVHQAALLRSPLGAWLESAARPAQVTSAWTLLSLNREGVTSLPGYAALYYAGSALGSFLQWSAHECIARAKMQRAARAAALWLAVLLAASAALWAAAVGLDTSVQRVSRRFCNAPYAAWVLAAAASQVAAAVAADLVLHTLGGSVAPPPGLAAVSAHMLPVFLVANLSTGAVNLTVDTLRASQAEAVLIVGAHAALLWAVAGAGRRREAKGKRL